MMLGLYCDYCCLYLKWRLHQHAQSDNGVHMHMHPADSNDKVSLKDQSLRTCPSLIQPLLDVDSDKHPPHDIFHLHNTW